MSTIKVNSIVPPNVGEGVTIDGLQMPTAGAFSNRNLIINGAMQVAQRGISAASVTTAGYTTVDRMLTVLNTLGTWTVSQEADAPAGFKYSLKHTCTTADSSPSAADYAIVYQRIETQNIVPQIGYGTSSAKDLTLSFWVKSNKTGAASVSLFYTLGAAGNRFNSTQYTINSADTWEYKTVTVAPNSTANGATDIETGMTVEWWMNSGSAYSGTAVTGWSVDGSTRNSSNIGIGGTVGDYFQITGVQLEVGSKATPFEHEIISQTLAKCQRYFYSAYNAAVDGSLDASLCTGLYYNTNRFFGVIHFPTTMRIRPTLNASSGANGEFGIFRDATANSLSSLTAGDESLNSAEVQATSAQNAIGTKNWPGFLRAPGNTAYLFFEAEL